VIQKFECVVEKKRGGGGCVRKKLAMVEGTILLRGDALQAMSGKRGGAKRVQTQEK